MSQYYQVLSSIDRAPLRDYLLHGFESRREFEKALRFLVSRWQGRIGEGIGNRHGFLLLRFHDTPGGKPDEAWLPRYLLKTVEPPADITDQLPCEQEDELDKIFWS